MNIKCDKQNIQMMCILYNNIANVSVYATTVLFNYFRSIKQQLY